MILSSVSSGARSLRHRRGLMPPVPSVPGVPALGYLFWHAPGLSVDRSAYEEAIGRWHRALADAPPAGFEQSWTWRLAPPPWLEAWPDPAYLDVYMVADFTALGALNAAVPSGRLQAPHDLVASHAAQGSGALFAHRAGQPAGRPERAHLRWYDKPAGTSYPEVLAALAEGGGSVWLRQMVLGAGPELLVVGGGAGPPSMPPVWAARPFRVVA
jgi:hypothetical protein